LSLRGNNLVDGMFTAQREAMDRAFNERFLSHIDVPHFEIEASGLVSNQMGTLRGTLSRWEGRTIVEARFTANRYVWLTVGVVGAFLVFSLFGVLCAGAGVAGRGDPEAKLAGLVCVVAIFGFPGLIATVVGVLHYLRFRNSEKVLREFLTGLFADVTMPMPPVPSR
jgi:hypothetical protein